MGFGNVGIGINVSRILMERLNDHSQTQSQSMCTRAWLCNMYLIFVMTGRNICNDGDKGVQICISPTFIEPRAFTRE